MKSTFFFKFIRKDRPENPDTESGKKGKGKNENLRSKTVKDRNKVVAPSEKEICRQELDKVHETECDKLQIKINGLQYRLEELEVKIKSQNDTLDEYEEKTRTYDQNVLKLTESVRNSEEIIRSKNEFIASLEKEHALQIDGLNKAHESECGRLQAEISGLRSRLEESEVEVKSKNEFIASLEKEHALQIDGLNKAHESECGRLQAEISGLRSRLEEVISAWADDKKGILRFFIRYIENLDQAVNVVLNDADPDSQAYIEISQMADSMNGYLVFKKKAVEIIEAPARKISEIQNLLSELLISDVKYEKSWFNTIARLYAYSQVGELEAIFGYYDSYSGDIRRLYRSLENLSELLGVSDIRIPALFRDEYSSKEYEYKNTNLVIPQLYPDYVEMLKPMAVYDFSRAGYTYDGDVAKPVVAYNINN